MDDEALMMKRKVGRLVAHTATRGNASNQRLHTFGLCYVRRILVYWQRHAVIIGTTDGPWVCHDLPHALYRVNYERQHCITIHYDSPCTLLFIRLSLVVIQYLCFVVVVVVESAS